MTEAQGRRASDPLILEMHGDMKVLCSQMETLLGNGQPGLIAVLDNRVGSLEETRASAHGWLKGALWVVGAMGATIAAAATLWGYLK